MAQWQTGRSTSKYDQWVVHWPTQGTVQYLVGNVVFERSGKMKVSDVYLIIDRRLQLQGIQSHNTEEGNKQTPSTITINVHLSP